MTSTDHHLRPARKLAFWGVLVAIVVLVPFFALEAAFRLAGVKTADDPFIQFGKVSSFFGRIEVDGELHLKVKRRDINRQGQASFPVTAPPGTFRIFSVGGSASAGWPHPQEEIYTAYLQETLQRAYPDRKIEVINVSAHAYAAYRVRLIVDEIVDYDPDLIVIYSGNNEFLEKRSYAPPSWWRQPLVGLANRSVVYRVVRGSVIGKTLWPENTISDYTREHQVYEVQSKILQKPLPLRQDPVQFDGVTRHYEASIEAMLDAAGSRGIPVILLTVPVNLRGWEPNVSVNAVDGEALATFNRHYQAGQAALLRGDHATAAAELRKATEIDPAHAEAHFALGRALEATGDRQGAGSSYSHARDVDANPFRAHSTFNETIREAAADERHVELVDAAHAFNEEAASATPGFDLFLDYVHPNRDGNMLIAELIFDRIVEKDYIAPEPAVREFEHAAQGIAAASEPYHDRRDFRMLYTVLGLYAMMHQEEQAVEMARYLIETPGALEQLGDKKAQIVREAHALFKEALQLRRRQFLGEPVSPEEFARSRERLIEFYHKAEGA